MRQRGFGNASSRGVTIREGTSEKHWYGIAVYSAICSATLAVLIVIALSDPGEFSRAFTGGHAEVFGMMFGLMLLVYSLLATSTAVLLFKDSVYVRGVGVWRTKWWYYIGIPVGACAVLLAGSVFLGNLALGFGLSVFVFPIAMYVSSTVYLYHRHHQVGVP